MEVDGNRTPMQPRLHSVIIEPAEEKIALYTKLGFDKLPMCMAKTHLSISHDPLLKGRPTGFTVPIRELRLSNGAGFIVAVTGAIMTMPGLPRVPSANNIYLNDEGQIEGLF